MELAGIRPTLPAQEEQGMSAFANYARRGHVCFAGLRGGDDGGPEARINSDKVEQPCGKQHPGRRPRPYQVVRSGAVSLVAAVAWTAALFCSLL